MRRTHLGVVATCNPDGGSRKPAGDRKPGKWRAEFNEVLRNRRVVVVPDNDPVGIAHADTIAASVSAAARVRIVHLPGVLPKGDLSDWIAAGGTREQLEQLAEAAPDFERPVAVTAVADAGQPEIRHDTHTVIEVGGGRLPDAIDAAELCLLEHDKGIFQRGDFIVRPAIAGIPIADDRQMAGLRLIRVGVQHLVERFTRLADFKKYDARTQDWVSIDCPANIAAAYLERTGMWKLPVIAGVVNAPTLRPDGSIIEEPGYDPATGILYDPGSVAYYPVPNQPAREQARAALDELISLIEEFPFIDDGDGDVVLGKPSPSRSVALSSILSAMIGPSLPTAPLHAITATGSGKSKLADIASVIATGHECPVIWLGEPDPCLTIERARQEDPYRRALADVLHQWRATIGDAEVSVKRVIEYATEFENRPSGDFNAPAMKHPDFREALLVVAGSNGSINSRRLGQWLARMRGKVVDGLRIEEGLGRDHGGLIRWKVVAVAP